MTDAHKAFLQAIHANPDDDLPKLALSDYLEEQGDHRTANALRLFQHHRFDRESEDNQPPQAFFHDPKAFTVRHLRDHGQHDAADRWEGIPLVAKTLSPISTGIADSEVETLGRSQTRKTPQQKIDAWVADRHAGIPFRPGNPDYEFGSLPWDRFPKDQQRAVKSVYAGGEPLHLLSVDDFAPKHKWKDAEDGSDRIGPHKEGFQFGKKIALWHKGEEPLDRILASHGKQAATEYLKAFHPHPAHDEPGTLVFHSGAEAANKAEAAGDVRVHPKVTWRPDDTFDTIREAVEKLHASKGKDRSGLHQLVNPHVQAALSHPRAIIEHLTSAHSANEYATKINDASPPVLKQHLHRLLTRGNELPTVHPDGSKTVTLRTPESRKYVSIRIPAEGGR